jgi:hypothetical protein
MFPKENIPGTAFLFLPETLQKMPSRELKTSSNTGSGKI